MRFYFIVLMKFLPKPFSALTVFPFIFLKDASHKHNNALINHEKIHLRQQIEMLWLPFFIWYAVEFIIKLIRYRQWMKAYHAVGFEREAYRYEHDTEYLKRRKPFAFLGYIR